MGFDYVGGIDFSGAREPLTNLWTAVATERDGRLHVLDLRPLPFREELAQHVAGGWHEAASAGEGASILWGADFPFGLPLAGAMMLVDGGGEPAWADVVQRIAAMEPNAVRETCAGLSKAGRRTDACGAMAPLDLRLYKQTVAGMRWLHELSAAIPVSILPQAPRDDAGCTLVEVYPSVTRTDLGIKAGRSAKRVGEVKARPLALSAWVTFDHPSLAATAAGVEDAWDAVLACLTAWLVRDDLDQPARVGVEPRVAGLEGWIYRHPEAVGLGHGH